MKLLALLCLTLMCSALPFAPKLPKRYLVEEFRFDHVENEGKLLRLVFDSGVFFVERSARLVINGWKSGQSIEVRRETRDQPVVALCFGEKAVMAYTTPELPKIQRLSVRFFSLRCSGSTYFQFLLRQNFPTLSFGQDLGWKHGPSGPSISGFKKQAKSMDELVDQDFEVHGERMKEAATIMIVRNPYDWVRSLYKNSWWVLHPSYGQMEFSEFLHTPVRISLHQPADTNFFDEKLYDNPIEMRSSKLKLLLSLTCRSPEHFIINYETLLENAPAVIAHIASTFGWRPRALYEPVDYRIRSGGQKFEMPSYPNLGATELNFIQEHIDADLEHLLSYDL